MRVCSKCKLDKPVADFQLYKGRPSGQCRSCKTSSEKVRRAKAGVKLKVFSKIEDGQKLCLSCGVMKVFDQFSKSDRGLGGLAAYCKGCIADKYRDADKAKIATAKYRRDHRERHLAAHRVRMFEYRTRKKVTDDGTVTDEFLKLLYATEYCYYCLQYTPTDLRTADHIISLASGGKHSACNLVMACWSCNCSKQAISEDQFLTRGLKLCMDFK